LLPDFLNGDYGMILGICPFLEAIKSAYEEFRLPN
jgi:hypothetical protein